MFHGAPSGYALPVWSPGSFVLTVMQIDTNDGSGKRGGPLPAIKRPGGATPAPEETHYNPLLECPCTTRIVRNVSAGTIDGALYDGDCRGEPLADLLDPRNPTCDVST